MACRSKVILVRKVLLLVIAIALPNKSQARAWQACLHDFLAHLWLDKWTVTKKKNPVFVQFNTKDALAAL